MSILLLILKWIGILLGILLLLVLLLITLALCVPVRYRISGCNKDTFQYSFKISFLLSIVSVKKKKESQQIVFSVFHIPIKKIGANKKKRTKSTPDNTTKEESFETEKKEKEIKQDKPVLSVQEKKNNKKKKKRRKRKGKKKNFSFQKISSIMKCIKQNKKILKRLLGEIKALLLYLAPKKVKGEFLFGTGDPSTTGLLTGFISLFPVVYQDGFFVRPDFEEKKLEADFSAKGRMRLLYFLRLFFRLYRDRELKRMWKQIHRLKKEAL